MIMTLFMLCMQLSYVFLTLKKPLLMEKHTHTNTRSLTLVWWFTSASLLRRSSTIWSWPLSLAIYNAVFPSCTCKGEQDQRSWIPYHQPAYVVQAHTSMTIVKRSLVPSTPDFVLQLWRKPELSPQLWDKIWEWPGKRLSQTDFNRNLFTW